MGDLNRLKWKKHITTILSLCCLSCVVPITYLLSKENNEPTNWFYIIIPVVIGAIVIGTVVFSRKVVLGSLYANEMDMETFLELQLRKGEKPYNYFLLSNVNFWLGDFRCVINAAEKYESISKNRKKLFTARHYKVLSLFLLSEYRTLPALIEQQRNDSMISNKKECNVYYCFIEMYIDKRYDEAVLEIKKLLLEEHTPIFNNQKVLVYYLIRMCGMAINDASTIKKCEEEIILADKNCKTIFRKALVNQRHTGDGSVC